LNQLKQTQQENVKVLAVERHLTSKKPVTGQNRRPFVFVLHASPAVGGGQYVVSIEQASHAVQLSDRGAAVAATSNVATAIKKVSG